MALTLTNKNAAAARSRYVTDTVQTHSPARLVTMMYDKLCSELERAEIALGAGDFFASNDALTRAQAIVLELRSSLKVELWEGGPGLAALYGFFVREIIAANVTRDAARAASVRTLVEPLRQTWHQAAAQVAAGA